MYKQEQYITVHAFDTPQEDFERESIDGNGLAILMPTVCTITEELNGTYELYMEHPIDEEGRWRLLEVDNIIKADGQLFRIKSRKTKLSAKGEKVRSVQCLHIWYDLGGWEKDSYTANYYAALWLIRNLETDIQAYWDEDLNWKRWGYFYIYNFHFSTDCGSTAEEGLYFMHLEPANLVAAAIGTESSFVNIVHKEVDGETITPELHRDNFNWNIDWRKRNAVDNAFSITHKVDMIDIEEIYDTSNYYTHLFAYDNAGNFKGRCINPYAEQGHVPHTPRIKHVKMQYTVGETKDDEGQDCSEQRYEADFSRYYRSITKPRLTLKCNYAELSDTDLYKDYIDAKHCNVGDSGTVYCEDLGITQTMKVVRKKKDLINKDKIEITFGSKLASITSPEYMSQTINNSKFTNNEFFKPVTIE